MFPIGDDNPQIHRPYATYAIITLNVLSWVVLQGLGTDSALGASVCQYGLIPADLFADSVYNTQQICHSGTGSWSGLLTSMFMHGSWMHIIGNLWFLWVFGDNVEDAMGSVRFALFYILSGLFAAVAQILANPSSAIPMVGASGAIGGVMGAYIMLYPRVKVRMAIILVILFFTFRIPAFVMLGYWIAVQVLGGLSSLGATGGGVAFWAHIGGFAAGAALVWLFKDNELLLQHPHHGWRPHSHRASDIWNDPSNRA